MCESVNGAASDGATPKTPAVVPPNSGECLPIDTTPIVVTLSNPQPSLEQLWADDGTVWLLPGYAFTGSDGGTYNVIAVQDQYVQQTTPTPDTTVAPPDTIVVSPPATVVVSPPDTANPTVTTDTAVTPNTAVATVTS